MPRNPHEYCLRSQTDDETFVRFVNIIRHYGYEEEYFGRVYIRLDFNDYYYWTMGDTIENTILINRKRRNGAQYDLIVDKYDDLFKDPESIAEDREIVKMINYNYGRVLDIGCGTGLLADYCVFDDYVGIDPSLKMLDIFRMKHNDYSDKLIHTDFESFYAPKKFDIAVALYGVASYINPLYYKKIFDVLNDGGRYFLMFYADDYYPHTYEKTHIEMSRYMLNEYIKLVFGSEPVKYRDYLIYEGLKCH
jgi:SAM-dependent methyltransferase